LTVFSLFFKPNTFSLFATYLVFSTGSCKTHGMPFGKKLFYI
jgi:hypothetical protein